jgi:hypothetical protein
MFSHYERFATDLQHDRLRAAAHARLVAEARGARRTGTGTTTRARFGRLGRLIRALVGQSRPRVLRPDPTGRA